MEQINQESNDSVETPVRDAQDVFEEIVEAESSDNDKNEVVNEEQEDVEKNAEEAEEENESEEEIEETSDEDENEAIDEDDEDSEDEEVEVEEELREVLVAVHVGNRVQMDQGTNASDEQRHRDRQRIDQEADVDGEVAGGHPLPQRLHEAAFFCWLVDQTKEHDHGGGKRATHRQRG